jgi:hypothetical protein
LAKLATCIAEGAALAGKNTDEVKRKMKNANVDTIWNVSDDFRTTDRAMANAPKNPLVLRPRIETLSLAGLTPRRAPTPSVLL